MTHPLSPKRLEFSDIMHQTPQKQTSNRENTPLCSSPITPTRKKSLFGSAKRDKSDLKLGRRKALSFNEEVKVELLEPKELKKVEKIVPMNAKQLKTMYSIIRKKTGTLGGGGAGGAIYGEVTQESFQRVVDCLVQKCDFTPESVFLDIGAGLGKPNFHVAINPGVKSSYGVELIGGRWWQSMCLLQNCIQNKTIGSYAKKVFFAHANVTDMSTFDPITHVYSFNRGFPPEAMRAVAAAFHASVTAQFFICFDKINTILNYGFQVELVDWVSTKMAGSGEQHRCFVYRRIDNVLTSPAKCPPSSPIKTKKVRAKKGARSKSEDEWMLVQPPKEIEYAPHVTHSSNYLSGMTAMSASLETYVEWIRDQIGLHRCERATRSRSRNNLV